MILELQFLLRRLHHVRFLVVFNRCTISIYVRAQTGWLNHRLFGGWSEQRSGQATPPLLRWKNPKSEGGSRGDASESRSEGSHNYSRRQSEVTTGGGPLEEDTVMIQCWLHLKQRFPLKESLEVKYIASHLVEEQSDASLHEVSIHDDQNNQWLLPSGQRSDRNENNQEVHESESAITEVPYGEA
ncbi:hypothetical protein ZIOFF_064654 [Zingiber officinale]|uniref:Uncharacterized protein n=1 Tax=Zingiber officinale TaxID=94328 RepID=A0A8J5EW69_ZINOF|nr:hypothetical protein ZIOFF_064654 [Zingiber officinale]